MIGSSAETKRLTDQQARPLEVRGASVALSAGAGCGKTTVLTERFLRDLEGPELRSLQSIVALTFTEKSARELRQRIRQQCRAKLALGENVAHWRDILRALEAALIGTFHEFCGRWLRRHAIAARIDPEFTVLDATIAGAVREEALARCLRRLLAENDPDLIALAVEFGMRTIRESLGALISGQSAGDLAAWAGHSAEEVVGFWKTVWEEYERPELFRRVCFAARQSFDLLAAQEFAHPKLRELRDSLLERLPSLEGLADSDGELEAIREAAFLPRGLRKEHWPSPEVNEAVKQSLQAFRDAIDEYRKKRQWNEVAALLAAEHGLRYARLTRAAHQEYEEAKRARGGLDFDDLLLKTRVLLRATDEATRADLAGSIALLLVDEFQDTDPVQSEILRMLGGAHFEKGRLFVVGDSKQSIYRFRGAQPRIFQAFRDDFPSAGHHFLTENFRSVPGILDFVNALFHGVFPDAGPKLAPGPGTPERRDQPVVEFLWAAEPKDEAETKGKNRENRQREARWLARRLRQRLDEGWTVRDRETREPRPAHAGDLAFLFRAMTDVGPFERALYEEGFDYYTIGGSAFYAQQEVNDLINLLSVIEDPLDAVALAGALRSPFFCLSDDGLFWLATTRRDLPEGLQHADAVHELSDLDRRQALRARALLDRWRGFKDREPIAALVDRVLDESGYEAALLGEFLGDRKRANARKLVRMARTFDEQGGFTLADFVARLRADLRNPPREEQAATTDEEGQSVRLMSIHQAKGLEFPIVVLPDLNRVPGGARQAVAYDSVLGPLVRLSQDFESESGDDDETAAASGESLGWRIYAAREQREAEAEALRLFYVATTRARDALILSAGLGPDEKPKSPALKLLARRFDRRTGACRGELPDGWGLPRVSVTLQAPEPREQVPRRRASIPPREVARAICETTACEESAPAALLRRPRFVDLDPALALPPSAARLDRLVRTILADPKGLNAHDLPAVAHRAARKQTPAAHVGLVDDAVARLLPCLNAPIGSMLTGAKEIRRGVAWTLAWPPDGAEPTVFQGRIDLLFLDRQGGWGVVILSDAATPEPRERLRLLLGTHAAALMGCDPVRRAWQVRLGPGGGLHGEECFGDATIEAAARAFFSSVEQALAVGAGGSDR